MSVPYSFGSSGARAFMESPGRVRLWASDVETVDTPRGFYCTHERKGFITGGATATDWSLRNMEYPPHGQRGGDKACYQKRTIRFRSTPDIGTTEEYEYTDTFGNPQTVTRWIQNTDTSQATGIDIFNRYTGAITQSQNGGWVAANGRVATLGSGYMPWSYPTASLNDPLAAISWDSDTISGTTRTQTKAGYWSFGYYYDSTNDLYFVENPPNYPPGVGYTTVYFDVEVIGDWENDLAYATFIEDARDLFNEARTLAEAEAAETAPTASPRIRKVAYDTAGVISVQSTGTVTYWTSKGGSHDGFTGFYAMPRFDNVQLPSVYFSGPGLWVGGGYRWQDYRGSTAEVGDAWCESQTYNSSNGAIADSPYFAYAAIEYEYTGPMASYWATGTHVQGTGGIATRSSALLPASGLPSPRVRARHYEIPGSAEIDALLDDSEIYVATIDLAANYNSVTPAFPLPA